MIIEFSISNFLSFKDKVTFSMEKSIGNENMENIFINNELELLKSSVIYGANASGKTNLIKALTAAILIVRNSNFIPIGEKWGRIVPFLFDKTSKEKPTIFEFVILINGIKYNYSFSLDNEKIYSESLYVYNTQKPTEIFTRTDVNNYHFPKNETSKLDQIKEKNSKNKLFLATATNWNYDKTKEVYLWFMNGIDTYDSFDAISKEVLDEYKENKNNLKDFLITILKQADIFIKDIDVNYTERDINIPFTIVNNSDSSENPKFLDINIQTLHEIKNEDGKIENYKLNIYDESMGTQKLFMLAPLLKDAFERKRVIIIDEFEKSMHPLLSRFIISIFNNSKINKANSQLIFTTHDVSLLDLEIFRRDQIWFTEKNPVNGVTDLYSLDDFPVRKDENVGKGYINGKYGAIPFISGKLWEDEQD